MEEEEEEDEFFLPIHFHTYSFTTENAGALHLGQFLTSMKKNYCRLINLKKCYLIVNAYL